MYTPRPAQRPALRPDTAPTPGAPQVSAPGPAECLARFLLRQADGVAGMEALAAMIVNAGEAGRLPLSEAEGAAGLEGDPRLAAARRIARRALAGQIADPTGGAVRFHRVDAAPAWSLDQAPTFMVGRLLFYR